MTEAKYTSRVRCGLSFVRFWIKIDRVLTAPHFIMFLNFDQASASLRNTVCQGLLMITKIVMQQIVRITIPPFAQPFKIL